MNINIDTKEVMRYMGCSENTPVSDAIINCINEIKDIMTPRFTYKVFDIEIFGESVSLIGTNVVIKSKDIATLLKNSKKCIILCATIGTNVDKKISLYQATDMEKAMYMDAAASSAIESVCETAVQQIKTQEIVKNLTIRYSPGYGDFDIGYQKEILNLTDAYKKIGLTSTSSMMLTPLKSVTAIIGITDKPYMTTYSCGNCNLKDVCNYKGCGNK